MTSATALNIVNEVIKWQGKVVPKGTYKPEDVRTVLIALHEWRETPKQRKQKADLHQLFGKYYGYPQCCIDNFVQMNKLAIPPAIYYDLIGRGNENYPKSQEGILSRIMCDKCYTGWQSLKKK